MDKEKLKKKHELFQKFQEQLSELDEFHDSVDGRITKDMLLSNTIKVKHKETGKVMEFPSCMVETRDDRHSNAVWAGKRLEISLCDPDSYNWWLNIYSVEHDGEYVAKFNCKHYRQCFSTDNGEICTSGACNACAHHYKNKKD